MRVILPGGLLLQGPITDGRNEPGGWLLIQAEQYDLAVEQPASFNAGNGHEQRDRPLRGVGLPASGACPSP
ncbi:hypothetical protein C4J91_2037 [Pseudomonas sp. R3-52-08]|nr:hypothetical protein C4J91_2037 [Pseudomonas sp. R3-52-08]